VHYPIPNSEEIKLIFVGHRVMADGSQKLPGISKVLCLIPPGLYHSQCNSISFMRKKAPFSLGE
jgi:hypothetical protein